MDTYTKYRFLSLMIFFFLMGMSNINAQFNIKVGFNLGYTQLEKTDAIFKTYAENNPEIVTPYSNVRFLNGLAFGGRYMMGNFGLDLEFANKASTIKAEGIPDGNGGFSNSEWKVSMTDYSIGLENYISNFSYGATIGYQKLTYKTDVPNSSSKEKIYSENQLASKFFISIESPSDMVSFAIRPYVSVPWDVFNIDAVDKQLNVSSTSPSSDFDEKSMVFGVSFFIYNGPQR